MKTFSLALLFCSTLLASEKSAKEAFLADAKVNASLAQAGPDYRLGLVQAIMLKESCGYLGCVTDYLMGATLTNSSANSKSVLAKVQLTGDTVMLLEVLPEYTTTITTK